MAYTAIDRERRLVKPINDLVETLFNPSDSYVIAHERWRGSGILYLAEK